MRRGSKLYSILHLKCPRCHDGKLFLHPTYHLGSFMKMREFCPVCGLRFEKEPSFFYGAMYVTYAFQVIVIAVTGLLLWWTLDPSTTVYIVVTILANVLLLPLSFRMGRAVWINLFVSYEPRN